jgi:hypothetical protein
MNKGHLNDLVGISYTHPYEEPSAPCTKIEKSTSTTIATASCEELAKAITMSPSNKRTIDCQPNRPRIPEEQSKEGLCHLQTSYDKGESEYLRQPLLTPSSIGSVTDVTTQTSRKEIHLSKDGSNHGGSLGTQTELLFKVKSSCVVHGNFDTKAECVLDED